MTRNSQNTFSRTVLVTRKRIDEAAQKYLNERGFNVVFVPPYSTPSDIAESLRKYKADALMVSQGKMTKEVISATPTLGVVVKHGSGVNNINIQEAEKNAIPVYRALGANAQAVAEHALTLILASWKSLPKLDHATKGGDWLKSGFIGRDFRQIKLGLVGFGAIGSILGKMCQALGASVSVYDPASLTLPEGMYAYESLDDLLDASNVVSLHCPLTHATRHLIDAQALRRIGPDGYVVNTARGGIIDEEALNMALRNGEIGGAALDSFATEPPNPDCALFTAPNLIVTPHVGGVTQGAERAMAMGAAQHIVDHFAGREIDARYHVTSAELGGLTE